MVLKIKMIAIKKLNGNLKTCNQGFGFKNRKVKNKINTLSP